MLAPALGRDGLGDIDPTRQPITQPQRLVYSARVAREKLSCYYKFCRCYCAENVLQRTFLDVYANAIHLNTPDAACCCCMQDRATIWFYDNTQLGTPVAAGCCDPAPWCCMHCCGCFGDVVAFNRSFECCLCDRPKGHYCVSIPLLLCCCYLCLTEYVVGFAEGEASRVADAARRAKMGEFGPSQGVMMMAHGQPVEMQPMGAPPQQWQQQQQQQQHQHQAPYGYPPQHQQQHQWQQQPQQQYANNNQDDRDVQPAGYPKSAA